MREYEITIKDSEQNEIVLGSLNEESTDIQSVVIKFETENKNVTKRANSISPKIIISGNIDNKNAEKMEEIFSWAFDVETKKLYRTVVIKIKLDNDKTRVYTFPEMFVVDYIGNYGTENQGFELHLNQNQGNVRKISASTV